MKKMFRARFSRQFILMLIIQLLFIGYSFLLACLYKLPSEGMLSISEILKQRLPLFSAFFNIQKGLSVVDYFLSFAFGFIFPMLSFIYILNVVTRLQYNIISSDEKYYIIQTKKSLGVLVFINAVVMVVGLLLQYISIPICAYISSFIWNNLQYDFVPLLYACASMFCMCFFCGGFMLFGAAISLNRKTYKLFSFVLILWFVINRLSLMLDSISFLKFLSPFSFFDIWQLSQGIGLQIPCVFLIIGFILVALSAIYFNRREFVFKEAIVRNE